MKDWNVVVTVQGREFNTALDVMRDLGRVEETGYYNLILMHVADPGLFPETLQQYAETFPMILKAISRAIPVSMTFHFQDVQEFQEKAADSVLQFAPDLAGKSFHVRMHRRGFKGRLVSPEQERFLNEVLLEKLEQMGNPGSITFDDPDYIIALETVGTTAGMSLWSRTDRHRFPFLHLD